MLASIVLGLDRGISVRGQDFHRFAARLADSGIKAEPCAALLALRRRPLPELVLIHGADTQ